MAGRSRRRGKQRQNSVRKALPRLCEIDSAPVCVNVCYMKTITVREAQHNLASVLRQVEQGEEIEVVRRSRPVARIVPIRPVEQKAETVDWSDLDERLYRIWGGRNARGHTTDEILQDLRGD